MPKYCNVLSKWWVLPNVFRTHSSKLTQATPLYGEKLVHIHYHGSSIIQVLRLLRDLGFTSQDSAFEISDFPLQVSTKNIVKIHGYPKRYCYLIDV
jgi:hypothetical protein